MTINYESLEVGFCTEVDHDYTTRYVRNIVCKSTVIKMVMMRYFEVISDKCNMGKLCNLMIEIYRIGK
jgi:hypothetical protein